MHQENTFIMDCFSTKRVLSIAKEGHLVKKVLTMYRKRFYLNSTVIHIKYFLFLRLFLMSTSTQKINHELINIQVAIELDKGKKIAEVAEKFGLKISAVKAVARELVTENQQKKTAKSSRFTDSEREVLVGRIGVGESIEDICSDAGVTEKTLRRWCKQRGVTVPRRLDQISLVEQVEIRELLNDNNWREIAQAYNTSIDAIEEIAEPPHRHLDSESLSFLFEILREQPLASAKKLCGTACEAGLTIPESAVSSYRKRLKLLGII